MKHENYTGKIQDYINGIERDLTNVIKKNGHDLVKISILEQAKRLADIATHNNKFLIMMMDEFFNMIEKRHNVVDFREYDCWDCVPHEQLMKEFNVYLQWGLDAVDHFEDAEDIKE